VGKLRSEAGEVGPNGEQFCWWQVTVKGGRETRDLDAVALARVRFFSCLILAHTASCFQSVLVLCHLLCSIIALYHEAY
jgi:hypothetical protein